MYERDWPLVCLSCGESLAGARDALRCQNCDAAYSVVSGIPLLLAAQPDGKKEQQAAFFDESLDDEFELERPFGAPRLYQWLMAEKFHRSVADVSIKDLTALAVCGGSGMDSEFLARAGSRVISSDISLGAARRARERARRHGVPMDVIVADVERLPFPDASIDVVYVHDGLHHLERPLEGLAEMARVARRVVCVTEPARAAATRLAMRLGIALEHEEAGNRVARLGTEEIVSTLRSRGFSVVRAERYAMYYRHEPGRAMRVLSAPGLFSIARASFRVGNLVFGGGGNKLVVVAVQS